MKRGLLFSLGMVAICLGQVMAMTVEEIDGVFAFAEAQYGQAVESLDATKGMPRNSNADGSWHQVPIKDWTSGFFPGSLWLIYENSGEEKWLNAARKWTAPLEPLRTFDRHHDVGFMVFCSYGNGYRLTKDPAYKEIILSAADALASRFRAEGGVIQSWGSIHKENMESYRVIIDNMMNLELLLWAEQNGGEQRLKEIALSHADTTLKNHFRPDGSTYHKLTYDLKSGEVLKKETHQGFADESLWARGQAWAIYGYTMMFRETGDQKYLAQAEKASAVFRKRLPADGVPRWDFDAPDSKPQKDASAAAIASSAWIELYEQTGKAAYLKQAEKTLEELASDRYLAKGANYQCLLLHSVGNMNKNSEVDVNINYADYYFLEALTRLKKVKQAAVQREDNCVIIDAQKSLSLDFKLQQPGEYVVQLVHCPKEAGTELAASAWVDGEPVGGELKRDYWIEDGIVSTFTSPVVFPTIGKHTVAVECDVPPLKVRVIPKVYWQSRIKVGSGKYYNEWIKMHQSPEKQAAMEWYKNARFGMFIHWGVYSQAAGSWKGTKIEDSGIKGPRVAEWLMYTFNISRAEYREFANQFCPDKSFAQNIARLARDTGMKYVVITSKHHDGFALFDSACSDWDVADATPYAGDLIKELYEACRTEGLEFGVYYSHGHDWMDGCDANYAKVKAERDAYNVPTRPNGKNLWDPSPNSYQDYLAGKAYPQIVELINLMPELRLIWFDGDGLITEAQAFRFYKMIYDLNPNIIVNRRVGYEYGDYMDAGDNSTPKAGELVAKYFETCGTANHSWGFKAHDHHWKSTNQLLRNFVDIISKGGNYLLNIGPDGKGYVPEPCADSFREMGKWVKTNADAVYGTTRWTKFTENVNPKKGAVSVPGEFWFTAKGNKVYAMSITPAAETVRVESLNKSAGSVTAVRLLGSDMKLKWTQSDDALEIDFSGIATDADGFVVEATLE